MDLILGQEEEKIENREFDVLIIGAGAAGLSAAVYSVRSGLSTIILDASTPGGLTLEAPLVENYLGFTEIVGSELANHMIEHAKNYTQIISNCKVLSIQKKDKFEVMSEKGKFTAKAIIFATGTKHKHIGVKGENEYFGKGLSYCSTCDGYLFKNKKVLVIGGGNSGAIAAISMKNIAKEIKIYEFMPKFMCEDAYVKQIESLGIEYKRNVQVIEIKGDGRSLKSVIYKDRATGELNEEDFDGVFVYVGLIPQSEVAKNMGVKLTEKGFIQTDRSCRTNLELVYATGDVAGSFAQIIVAASDGAIAANSAWQDLNKRS